MSTYIKHSEDDSLTHYGVKGMKWKNRKAYAKADRLYDKNKVYRKVMDHYGPENNSKSARRFRKTWNKAFDVYASAQSGKYRADKAFKKLKKKGSNTIKSSKKAASKGYKKLNRELLDLQRENKSICIKET